MSLLLAVLACANDQKLSAAHDNYGAGDPAIEVEPRSIDFGALGAGESATESFVVRNVGSEESILSVSDIAIGGENASFTILTEEVEFTLPAGTEQAIDVAFTPDGAHEQAAEAIVDSDDPDHHKIAVALSGEGLVPELRIDPDPISFGRAYIGCTKEQPVTLTNVGSDRLIIDAIGETGDGFTLVEDYALPIELGAEESATVTLTFTPTEETTYTGQLSVSSNEPRGVRTADQDGEGKYAAEYTDTFEVPVDPPADILFFVDQSCSMDDDQRALGTNFADFISQLSSYTTDWHVLVVNDDDGCSDAGVLTNSSPDYQTRFENAVGAGGGDYTEAGLYVTSKAIQQTDSGDCNQSFLRPTALLHIVMVSDEPDQSPAAWSTYVNAVIAKKGDASLVKFSAIAGDYPSGCSTSNNSAEPGTGYYEAVSYTGGEFLSICSNWSTSVRTLADASIVVNTFTLDHTPIPETIEVDVDGRSALTGWSYDAATNSILFEEAAAPDEGSTVDVSYAGLASCD